MFRKDYLFNLPNLLSMSRGLLMPVLFYMVFHLDTPFMTNLFVVLYILVGLTDALDGYIARKYDICSTLGSQLDSYADILYYLGSAVFVYVLAKEALIANIYIFIFTLSMFALEIIVAMIKFKKPLFLHTLLSKFSALWVFATVILSVYMDIRVILAITILLYGTSFLENVIVFFIRGEVKEDYKGLLFEKKRG